MTETDRPKRPNHPNRSQRKWLYQRALSLIAGRYAFKSTDFAMHEAEEDGAVALVVDVWEADRDQVLADLRETHKRIKV